MKRVYLLFLSIFLCMTSFAQEKQFNEALNKGRRPRSFYCYKNEKGKGFSLDKLEKYAKSKNYLIGSYTTKEIKRFGDWDTAVEEFYFLPESEYPAYVFEFASVGTNYGFKDLKQGEIYWIYDPKTASRFKKTLMWTGSLENGKLMGKGATFDYPDDLKYFITINGEFQQGLPIGKAVVKRFVRDERHPEKVSFDVKLEITVGKLSDGMASFSDSGGKWGFVNANGEVVVAPTYDSVVKDFSNGRAEVVSNGKEIIIGKSGNYIDLTSRQKQLDAQQKAKEQQEELKRQQEERRKELARRQEEAERQRRAAEAEKVRLEKFRTCMPGDRVFFSQEWEHTERFLLFFEDKHNYTMRVVCFVEQNVNNGERLQIRVGSVESSNSNYYSTPKIDGIEYRKGDVLWIKPLKDNRWQIE